MPIVSCRDSEGNIVFYEREEKTMSLGKVIEDYYGTGSGDAKDTSVDMNITRTITFADYCDLQDALSRVLAKHGSNKQVIEEVLLVLYESYRGLQELQLPIERF